MDFSRLDAFWVVNWSTDDGGRFDHIDPHWREVTGQAADAARGETDGLRRSTRTIGIT